MKIKCFIITNNECLRDGSEKISFQCFLENSIISNPDIFLFYSYSGVFRNSPDRDVDVDKEEEEEHSTEVLYVLSTSDSPHYVYHVVPLEYK